MKPTLGVVGFTWLVPIVWGMRCLDSEYPLGTKCCKMCPPGSELKQRCDHSRETVCEPCEVDYYNDNYTYSRCKSCTVCEKDRGLQEVTPCEAHSDARCTCLPGYSEVARTDEKRCDPCPDGYFSKGGTDKCRPWRNCTAEGKRTLRPGNRVEDAICDDQSSIPKRSTTISLPFSPTQEKVAPTTKPRPIEANLTTHSKDPKTGFVAVFVISALLLVAGGASALLLFFWKAKKKHQQLERPEVLSGLPHEDERSSFRIPIQEEQTDSKSSLVQN